MAERDSWRRVCERLETEKQALKSERDELLREKERLEAALEPFARADRALGRTPGSDRTFRLETDTGYREIHRDAFRRARSVLENSKAGLADANSKSPAPSSQSERIAVLEAALGKVKHWAESRCPCHNEQPNPCPLCGASVENLEACKSAESTLPRDVLEAIRKASPRSALDPLAEGSTQNIGNNLSEDGQHLSPAGERSATNG